MLTVEERIYTPDQGRGWGLSVWREMGREAILSRELIWRLFMRDFSARYRQSILGILWALILPLIAVGTFVFLNRSGLLNVSDTGVPYPVYVLLGLTIWQVFAGGLTVCSNAIVAGGSMVVKINFPKETLVVAAMGQVIFELLVRVILLAAVMIIFKVAPKWTVVFFPLVLLPLLMLTLGIGFFLSLLNVLLRDVANVVTLATTFLMFLTPVVYPLPSIGAFAALMRINPLAGLVTASRDVVVTGYLTDPAGFVWTNALAMVFFFFAWRVFHLVEPRMAERV
jgi:lipopolysaccharide transport system permease protein